MPSLSRGSVISAMRTALRDLPVRQTQRYTNLMEPTLAALSDAGLIDLPRATLRDSVHVLFNTKTFGEEASVLVEVYQYLITRGYIAPVPEIGNFSIFEFFVTRAGEEWAAGGDPAPEDQEGYLSALKTRIPALDPVVLEYVRESLLTYHQGLFFSSAVMIGAASEKVVYLLMTSLQGAVINAQEKQTIENALERERGLPVMFRILEKNINRGKSTKTIPYPVHEGADQHLVSLQEAIRVQRNDAVHPKAGQVSQESVGLTLSAFPFECKKAYDFIDWFDQNPNSI